VSTALSVLRWIAREVRALLPQRCWPADRGEQAAARYLVARDWEILDANLRRGHDEGDLLALDPRGQVVLVEVKSSSGGAMRPELQVGPEKAARLRRLALRLSRDPRCHGEVPRIDVMTVELASAPDGNADPPQGPETASVAARETSAASRSSRTARSCRSRDRVIHHFIAAIDDGPMPRRRGVLRP
jgi:putative endonuclease